ncbi:transcriptional regulator with XRE-family HTH domain [Paenibacillus sp. V4I9]|uniref:helix-turn-helix domain-containing protein n=1 Tax=Paenibacillus sp. V4I9 TaxID=3042308 RepID=UPI00277E4E77|nr:helix-turn-helix transcriptional regulator [Paenibacillus sp. V4I9]MDQ0885004.1 transcriptional regulator with XRE-family HTH domain [Paenibacillus sp. V4I9]
MNTTHYIIDFVIESILKHNKDIDKDMNVRNITGLSIKYYRKLRQLTQDELAAKLNVIGINIDRPMISRIECQSREITDIEIIAIAKILNVSVEELFKEGEKL